MSDDKSFKLHEHRGERTWLAVNVTTHRHAPINGPKILVFAVDEAEAIAIVERALDEGLLGAYQRVTDISKWERQLDDIIEETPLEWLTSTKSPNTAVWLDTDSAGTPIVQKIGRDTARSISR